VVRYLSRRVVFYLIAAWAAITINFLIPRLMPGNPAEIALVRFKGKLPLSAVKALLNLFGLEHHTSLLTQYGQYWGQLAHGDLGTSFTFFPESVSQAIAAALPWTLVLIGVTTVISFVVGIVIGSVVGWRRGSPFFDGLVPFTSLFAALPYFWIGLLCVSVFAARLGWFPVSGGASTSTTVGLNWAFLTSAAYYAALPAITIVVASVGGWILAQRNMMVTTLSEDYIVMAEAKGLSDRRIMYSYAGRNAILPQIASFAMALGFVVSGALTVEIVFSYPGIGYVLYEAVSNEDYPLMQGVFLVITLAVLIANFIADIAYVLVDPRLRQEA
jgi:peptide/nickel transport system permease protein